jgi:hypothetical protein
MSHHKGCIKGHQGHQHGQWGKTDTLQKHSFSIDEMKLNMLQEGTSRVASEGLLELIL